MYEFALRPDGEIESLTAHFVANIAVDSILRVCDHKNNTRRFEGQEYLQLTLPNAYGTFLGGKKVWVEADFVDIITAQQYRAKMKLRQQYNKGGEEDGLAIIQKNSQPDTRKVSGYFPNPGRYALDIGQGEETGYITVGPCRSYMFNNGGDRIVLIYPDNSFARSWEINKWPDKVTFKVKNLSSRDDLALVIM